MRYWPISTIAQSPYMPAPLAWELRQFYQTKPSEDAYYAAISVARRMQPVESPNLVIVESAGAPNRRVYVDYPTEAEWTSLERAAVMDHNGFTFILMDALH